MVHIAQICIAILVISAIVSAAPCGNREPSVAAHSDYSTHLSCENTNNDESFDDGNDSFVDTTNHVAVTEDAPCDDEVDGISSEETSSLSNQNFNIIGVSPGENIVDTVIIDNTLNNLIARDVTRKETSKTNNQNFNVIGVSPGKNVVDTVAISDTLNNLITRDVTRKENSKTNNQNFNIIGVSPGKNIVDTVAIDDTLHDLIARDVTRKETSKTNNQNFNVIGVSPGKNVVDTIAISDTLNDLLGGL